MPYEILDHTADIMVRITATTREELCDEARLALYAVAGHLLAAATDTEPSRTTTISVTGDDFAEVMHDWLSELLFWLEGRGRLCIPTGPFQVDDQRLQVPVTVVPLNRRACRFDREVKAVTYHQLAAGPTADGWSATVILDI